MARPVLQRLELGDESAGDLEQDRERGLVGAPAGPERRDTRDMGGHGFRLGPRRGKELAAAVPGPADRNREMAPGGGNGEPGQGPEQHGLPQPGHGWPGRVRAVRDRPPGGLRFRRPTALVARPGGRIRPVRQHVDLRLKPDAVSGPALHPGPPAQSRARRLLACAGRQARPRIVPPVRGPGDGQKPLAPGPAQRRPRGIAGSLQHADSGMRGAAVEILVWAATT